eukprot:5978808-Amphidinium_carterae.1
MKPTDMNKHATETNTKKRRTETQLKTDKCSKPNIREQHSKDGQTKMNKTMSQQHQMNKQLNIG